MKITIDIDGVLGKFIEEFTDFVNLNYNRRYNIEDLKNLRSFETMFNLSTEEIIKLLKEFGDTGRYQTIEPIKGSIEGIEELVKYHELHVVTSRRKDLFGEDTIKWLDMHYPNKFKSVNMKELDNKVEERGIFKRNKIAEINPDFHIDDDLDHIKYVKELPLTILVYTQPWNKDYVDDKLLRFNNWEEIVYYFKELTDTGHFLSL